MPDPKDRSKKPPDDDRQHEDEDLDEALEETFPASDPISPMRRGED